MVGDACCDTEQVDDKRVRPRWNVGMVLLFVPMAFFIYTCLAVYETVTTPITEEYYEWSVFANSLFWAGIGVSTLID